MVVALALSAAVLPGAVPYRTYASANYASTEIESYARQVAGIVNRERAANGLSPLKYSDKLSEAALVRAAEIQTSFSHTRPNGTSCFTAVTEAGISYRTVGENIAYGQRNPEEVMNAWMNSSGHRANILGANYEYIGVGVTYKNGTYYWSQFFAASNDLSGEVITLGSTTAATTKATVATTKQTAATTQATVATTKQTVATTQATVATTQQTAATTQATTASTTQPTASETEATTAVTRPTQYQIDWNSVCGDDEQCGWVAQLIKILNGRLGSRSNCPSK